VPRATAHVADPSAPGDGVGEAVEQLSIDGLVLELARDPARVLVRDYVVAVRHGRLQRHQGEGKVIIDRGRAQGHGKKSRSLSCLSSPAAAEDPLRQL
jgi:hypothetical protein